MENENRWATKASTDSMAAFVRLVANKLKIEAKCIPVGMSCGGLEASMLTIRYPELVSVLYLDAPVMNLLSMAGLGEMAVDSETKATFWRELVTAYGFDHSTVTAFRDSPIDHLDVLLRHNIPVLMLYGVCDNVVVYQENGKVLEDYYRANGGTIKVISKRCGHHPHGLEKTAPMIEFVEQFI